MKNKMISILLLIIAGVALVGVFVSETNTPAHGSTEDNAHEVHEWTQWSEPERQFGASLLGYSDVWIQTRKDVKTGFAEVRVCGRMPPR